MNQQIIDQLKQHGITADLSEVPQLPVQLDERYLVRSRVVCTSLGVPLYGKLRILSFEDSTITFEVLADRNCGFKDLLPGLPDE